MWKNVSNFTEDNIDQAGSVRKKLLLVFLGHQKKWWNENNRESKPNSSWESKLRNSVVFVRSESNLFMIVIPKQNHNKNRHSRRPSFTCKYFAKVQNIGSFQVCLLRGWREIGRRHVAAHFWLVVNFPTVHAVFFSRCGLFAFDDSQSLRCSSI